MNKNIKIYNLLPVILPLVLSLGTATVFKACGPMDNGMWMHCHGAQNTVVVVGIITAAIIALSAVVKDLRLIVSMKLSAIALSLAVTLVPGVIISLCKMNTMRCHAVMRPFVILFAVLTAVEELASIVVLFRKGKVSDERNLQRSFD
ncbi:DUF4418 family protein [Butyrivibrio sp. MC2013]|uniref:DUF4418 family protein n=1 Tax=Butyrivibrio sp. MC2013 TaxID=1280686 RepID=UPI0003F5B2CB|nr:DUF4418 family protein [Butyrivibrio sp. MC2013]